MCKKWKEVGNLAAVDGVRQRVGLAAQRQEGIDDLRVIKGNQCLARQENLVGKSSLSSRMKRGTFRQHKTTQHQAFMEIDGQFEPIRDEAGPIRSTRLPLRHCSCDPTRARNASVSHEVLTYVMFFARLVKKGIFPSPEIISPMPPKVVCSWVNIAWATDGF